MAVVNLEAFFDLMSDFKEWYNGMVNPYGIYGHQNFTDDEAIYYIHDAISYSIERNLSTSLCEWTLAYLY